MQKAIKAGLLIDGTGNAAVKDPVILINDERIVAVGTAETVRIPDGVNIIDLEDDTIMPGLIDCHSHISLVPKLGDEMAQMAEPPEVQVLRSTANLRKDLKGGVTTIRVAGEEFFIDILCRDSINKGIIPGPRLIASGPQISASNGHCSAVTRCDGEEAIRRTIRDNLRRGADVIKLFVTGGISTAQTDPNHCFYSQEEIKTAVAECHRVGIKIMAHAHGGIGVRWAIEAGIDSIEHGKAMSDEDIELLLKYDTWLVVNYAYMFHPDGGSTGKDWDNPLIREKMIRLQKQSEEVFKKCLKAGVKYAIGTDGVHGAMWFELKKVVDFGASEMDAIVAATRNGAELCGLISETGTIEPGKLADIISVKGNPLSNIEHVQNVNLIMKAGERFDSISIF